MCSEEKADRQSKGEVAKKCNWLPFKQSTLAAHFCIGNLHIAQTLFSILKCAAQTTKIKLDLKDTKEEHEEEEEEEVGLLVVVVVVVGGASFVA